MKKEILLIKIIFLFFVAKIKNNKKGGDRKWQKKRKLQRSARPRRKPRARENARKNK